ncbi:hypothetical protein [uncultured Mucilaginibacter sp.]|uniref:hypothetical protein n=1 Tax=uncultured Mucilaginibacter sp. TaxID=797541 RepID=UPI00263813D4|nr:hypothetical protein [uncultured Mucilaginibacter sp.]
MTNASLKTTETEYLIKFSVNQFDMEFVKSIFSFINQKMAVKEASATSNVKDVDEDYFSKNDYFSHLDEK